MRKFTLLSIIAVYLTSITARATHEYPALFFFWDDFFTGYHFTIMDPTKEGPGRILYDTEIDFFSSGLGFDGENIWAIKNGQIYAFDREGDFVTSFAPPVPNPVKLDYDGEYLWIGCMNDITNSTVYCVNLDGSPGPYAPFDVEGIMALTIHQDEVLTVNYAEYFYWKTVCYRYSKTGSFLGSFIFYYAWGDHRGTGLATDGSYIYLLAEENYHGEFSELIGKYDIEGNLLDAYVFDDLGLPINSGSLAFGYTYGTGIEAESLGKIKAFFDREGGENNNGGE